MVLLILSAIMCNWRPPLPRLEDGKSDACKAARLLRLCWLSAHNRNWWGTSPQWTWCCCYPLLPFPSMQTITNNTNNNRSNSRRRIGEKKSRGARGEVPDANDTGYVATGPSTLQERGSQFFCAATPRWQPHYQPCSKLLSPKTTKDNNKLSAMTRDNNNNVELQILHHDIVKEVASQKQVQKYVLPVTSRRCHPSRGVTLPIAVARDCQWSTWSCPASPGHSVR